MRRCHAQCALIVTLPFLTAAVHGALSENKAPPPLPDGAVTQLWAPAPEYAGFLAPLTFSPDQRQLALGSGADIVVWDAVTGKELRQLKGHKEAVTGLAFAPDGKSLASAGQDRTLILWDSATGKEERRLEGHTEAVLAVAFAPDGKTLASAGQDKTVRLWNLADGSPVRVLQHQYFVHAVAFTPDGKTLASAGKDRTIRLWDPSDGKEQRQLRGHQNRVNALAFSSNGRLLVSASQDSTVRIWDVTSGKEMRRLGGWTGEVKSIALSADDRTLVSVGRDQTIRVWEVLTGEERRVFRWEGSDFLALALPLDGRTLAASRPGTAVLWDVTGLLRDGKTQAIESSRLKLESLWAALAKDAANAHRAIWHLAAVAEQSVPFLAEQLEAQKGFDDPKRIAQLIGELSNDKFTVRARAADDLEALGRLVKNDLQKELDGRPSLDVRKRVEQLLERMETVQVPPLWLRAMRAIEVLERCNTLEARQALQKLGDGPPGSRLAEEATASVRRLNKRSKP
jgi:WD40 repeat protein